MKIRLTEKVLDQLNACESSTTFIKRNKLEGFPFERISEIKGDYKGYVSWISNIKDITENGNIIYYKDSDGNEYWNEYDGNNNLIHWKNSKGSEEINIIEYYSDGQLKKFNSLEIPWFEK